MNRRNRKRGGKACTLAAAAAVMLCGAPARAAESIVVHFEFDEPAIAGLFDPGRGAAQQQVSAALAKQIAAALGEFWAFGPGDAFPQLRVGIRRTAADWQLVTSLEASESNSAKEWAVTWHTDAELLRTGGFGPPAQIVASIERAFQSSFLPRQKDELIETLKAVFPLVIPQDTVRIDPSGAVLPLDWARYATLKMSDFLVRYQLGDGIAAVICHGVGTASPYPAPPPAEGLRVRVDPEYELAGQKQSVQSRLEEFRARTPLGIYLEHYDSLGAFLASPAGTPAPALAVPER